MFFGINFNFFKKQVFFGFLVLFLGVIGAFIPLFSRQIAEVKATTFSASTKVSETASGGSNTLKIQKFNGIYYLTQTVPNEGNTGKLQITTSTDGTTWSAFSTIINPTSPRDYAFGYYENGGFYYAIFSNYDYGDYAADTIYITTSSDAITWSPTTTVATAHVSSPGYIFASVASSSSYLSVVYGNLNTSQIHLATSTNGVSWSITTIRSTTNNELVNFVAGDDNNLHLLFNTFSDSNATTTTQVFLEYAKSANGGATWATTTLGRVDYDYYYSTANNALTLDGSGNPGVFYYKIDALSGCAWDEVEEWYVGDCAVTTSVRYAKYSGSSWTSSTVATFSLTVPSTSNNGIDNFSSLSFAPNGEAIMAGIGTDFNPYFIVSTNTLDISQVEITQIDNKALYDLTPFGNGITMVFNTSTLTAGVAFIGDDGSGTDRDVWFTTSSVLVAPSAPTGLSATASTTTQIDLSWNSAAGATSYVLYRDTNSGFTATTTVTTTALTSYSDTGLTASTQYYYKVVAVNVAGTSTLSSAVNATTLSAGTAPTAPSGAALSSITTSSMAMSWTDASNDEDGFVVEYTNDDASWVQGTTVAANVTSTSFASMAPNKFFRFRVAAYNTFGTSTFSTTTGEYTDPVVPGTPAFSSVSTSSLTVSWADNSNYSGTVYYVNYTGGFTTTTNTSTSIISLTPNTEYQFAVRAQYLSSSALYTAYSASSTTSTLALPNNTPAVTAISPTQATNGTGLVTVTTTVSDADADTVNLTVQYLSGDGVTWVSSTLGTVSGTGTFTTSSGQISGIATTVANAITFTWNSLTDLGAITTSTQIKITPNDGTDNGTAVTSTLTVDNEVPSAPTTITLTPATSSITIFWSDVSGASTYTVSTTAGSATTTASTVTTTAYSGLTPNTNYSFQVKVTDAYGNVGSFSTASSTYTNADIPGQPTATANGQTSEIVSWSANSNSASTVYQLYNVTTAAVVGTTTAVSYTVTGLTAGTPYQFKVRARYLSDGVTYSSYSDDSVAVSTAAVASTVSMTLATGASSTFQLSVGGTAHTATLNSITNGAASVTIASTPVTVSLTQGESDNIDTDGNGADDMTITMTTVGASSATFSLASYTPPAATSSGGGGSSYSPPYNISFLINNGATSTSNPAVTLTFAATNAAEMVVAEDSSFVGKTWEVFKARKTWIFSSPIAGIKTIFVRYRDNYGTMSLPASASIMFLSSASSSTSISTVTSFPAGLTATIAVGDVVKGASTKSVFYIAQDGKRYTFPNQDVYFSWHKDWTAVKTIPDSDLALLAIGGTVTYRPGTQLVKIQTDPKVYAVEAGGVLRWIETAEIARAIWGKDWGKRVRDVDPAIFPYIYKIGPSSISSVLYPVGSLVKMGSDYYLIGASMVKHKVTVEGLESNMLQMGFAIITNDLSAYSDGADIVTKDFSLVNAAGPSF